MNKKKFSLILGAPLTVLPVIAVACTEEVKAKPDYESNISVNVEDQLKQQTADTIKKENIKVTILNDLVQKSVDVIVKDLSVNTDNKSQLLVTLTIKEKSSNKTSDVVKTIDGFKVETDNQPQVQRPNYEEKISISVDEKLKQQYANTIRSKDIIVTVDESVKPKINTEVKFVSVDRKDKTKVWSVIIVKETNSDYTTEITKEITGFKDPKAVEKPTETTTTQPNTEAGGNDSQTPPATSGTPAEQPNTQPSENNPSTDTQNPPSENDQPSTNETAPTQPNTEAGGNDSQTQPATSTSEPAAQ